MEEGEGRKWSSKGEEGSRWRKLGGGGLTGRGSGVCGGWGRWEVEHDMGAWWGGRIPVVKGRRHEGGV